MKNDTIKYILIAILLVVIATLSFYLFQGKTNNIEIQNENSSNTKQGLVSNNKNIENINKDTLNSNKKMIMYKSPNCGCCTGYAEEMEKQGFEVEVVKVDDMSKIKEKYNIPNDKQSCHTSVIDNYFIEGHVPVEAVNKLLKEKPEIDGIGLPRMPSGTPGMPGPKRGPYEIYQSVSGSFLDYLKL